MKPRNGRRRATGPDQKTRDLVKERDAFRCVVCGRPVGSDHSVHHRRNRGTGGSSNPRINLPSNLLLVCGSGTTLCHGEITNNANRAKALEAGWVVPLNAKIEPAAVPVTHALYGRVLLADDGSVEPFGRAAA
jgi:5-methylcytosine-specific restriction protein A